MTKHFFAVSLLAALSFHQAAKAQTYFPNDAFITDSISGRAIIGRDAMGNNTSPTVTVAPGGSLPAGFTTYNSSTLNLSIASTVGGGVVDAYDSSRINIDGGTVNAQIATRNTSRVSMTGGTVSSFSLTDSSIVDQSGGVVSGQTLLSNSSLLNLYGINLGSTLTDPNFNNYSRYSLSGMLADGTSVNGRELFVRNGTAARFTLNAVPAPSALATLLIGAVPGVGMMLRRKRK